MVVKWRGEVTDEVNTRIKILAGMFGVTKGVLIDFLIDHSSEVLQDRVMMENVGDFLYGIRGRLVTKEGVGRHVKFEAHFDPLGGYGGPVEGHSSGDESQVPA